MHLVPKICLGGCWLQAGASVALTPSCCWVCSLWGAGCLPSAASHPPWL